MKNIILATTIFCVISITARASSAESLGRDTVYFEPNSTKITETGQMILNDFAVSLQKTPVNFYLVIQGHANSSENDPKKIAGERTKAVREYLLARGVDGKRLKEESHGSERPIASSDTAQSRVKNARVDILFTY